MNLIKKQKLINSLLLFLILCTPLLAKEDYRVEKQPKALQTIEAISHEGVLKQKANGFVYLDVSNEFITEVVDHIDLPGKISKRPTAKQSVGAHISVFHEDEKIRPKELGKAFSFTIKEIKSFTLSTRDGLKKLWAIGVDAPELEELRTKYGLSPRLKGYDFHITLGKQLPVAPEGWESDTELSCFNFSDEETLGLNEIGDFVRVDSDAVIQAASKIDQVAQLTLKSNGFVYLNVDNKFVTQTVDKLPVTYRFEPLKASGKTMGAHMSVLYENEVIAKEIWNVPEIGKWFQFTVKELRYVDKGAKRIWLLACDAPSLERYRKSLGLKPKLQNHDFHITLGYELLDQDRIQDDSMEIDEPAMEYVG